MNTRAGFCLGCRGRRVFNHVLREVYACAECGVQRSLTIDVSDMAMGGDEGRFWADVKVTPFCWPWVRPSSNKRGPRFAYKGRDVKIGRMAFFFSRGVWPAGGAVRTCANAFCCRPDHLVDLLQKDVPKLLKAQGRHRAGKMRPRRSCKRGHRLEGTNVGVTSLQRYCRICLNLGRRRRYKRLRAAGIPPALI